VYSESFRKSVHITPSCSHNHTESRWNIMRPFFNSYISINPWTGALWEHRIIPVVTSNEVTTLAVGHSTVCPDIFHICFQTRYSSGLNIREVFCSSLATDTSCLESVSWFSSVLPDRYRRSILIRQLPLSSSSSHQSLCRSTLWSPDTKRIVTPLPPNVTVLKVDCFDV
jgi:hypothetical protein